MRKCWRGRAPEASEYEEHGIVAAQDCPQRLRRQRLPRHGNFPDISHFELKKALRLSRDVVDWLFAGQAISERNIRCFLQLWVAVEPVIAELAVCYGGMKWRGRGLLRR
jgi:hypothetical protein